MSELTDLFNKTVEAIDYDGDNQAERAAHIWNTAQLADWTITKAGVDIADEFWLSIPQDARRCMLAALATVAGEILMKGD